MHHVGFHDFMTKKLIGMYQIPVSQIRPEADLHTQIWLGLELDLVQV